MKSEAFEKMWLSHFASGVPASDVRKYVLDTGNYIWHVFSWKLLPEEMYLTGEQARRAYDAAEKEGAFYLDGFGGRESEPLRPDMETARAIEAWTEVYVAGKEFEWTYIKTHEDDLCGPYFMRRADGKEKEGRRG